MNTNELLAGIKEGQIDTVQVAAPDMLGRLVGKRFTGDCFARQLVDGATHGCNYLFAVDIGMEPQDGFALANWDAGFGDFEFPPDFKAIYPIPWETASALVFCDFHHHDGGLVEQAPRTILSRQMERLAELGMRANMASELEFFLFNEDFDAASAMSHTGLTPASSYRIDYHLLQTGREEPLI